MPRTYKQKPVTFCDTCEECTGRYKKKTCKICGRQFCSFQFARKTCCEECARENVIRNNKKKAEADKKKRIVESPYRYYSAYPHVDCPNDCMYRAKILDEAGCDYCIKEDKPRGCDAGMDCIKYTPVGKRPKLELNDEIIAMLKKVANKEMSARAMYSFLGCCQSTYERLKKEAIEKGLVKFKPKTPHHAYVWEGEELELLKKVQRGELTAWKVSQIIHVDSKTVKKGVAKLERGELE